jgi:hypothetical protein
MPYFFTFKVDDQIMYRTQMTSIQCMDNTRKGARCKRKCVIGSPFCSTHLAINHHLQIRPSLIPNAGKGLFAFNADDSNSTDIVFKKDATICKYYGEIIDRAELNRRYGVTDNNTAPFVVEINGNRYEDAGKTRGIGSIANTNPGHQNARFAINRATGTASLKASRNIRNNQEIYLAYGNAYDLHQDHTEHTTTISHK